MAKMDHGKANRVETWRQSQRQAYCALPPVVNPATAKQLAYIESLLVSAGRRPYTQQEAAMLTIASASRLIKQLMDQAVIK